MASREVRTGEEQGDATSAEEPPSRKALVDLGRESCLSLEEERKSSEGNWREMMLSRLSPITIDSIAARKAGISVRPPPLSDTTEPSSAADKPSKESTEARPSV